MERQFDPVGDNSYDLTMLTQTIKVLIIRLQHAGELPLPAYHSEDAAGMDLAAAVSETTTIAPHQIVIIPTGFAVAIPEGYEGQIRPRSGLATKFGITLPNSPATIDADYRGELLVPLINLSTAPFTVERGQRIAQFLVLPVPRMVFEEVTELPSTVRGVGGFGHTGP